jgi:hypothetical protein
MLVKNVIELIITYFFQFLHIFFLTRGFVTARLFRCSEVLKLTFRLLLGVRLSRYLSGLYLCGNAQIYRVGEFLGPFAKLRKATFSFVMSVRPSFCSSVRMEQLGSYWTEFHETWRLNIFWRKRQNSRFIKIWQEKRVLYVKNNTYFWSYLSKFFLECEMFLTEVLKQIETNFLFNNVYFENHALFEIICKIWWGGLGHRQQYNNNI